MLNSKLPDDPDQDMIGISRWPTRSNLLGVTQSLPVSTSPS